MTKIDKTDLENISLIKKEFKLKNLNTIKIKKGDYEIEISTSNSLSNPIKTPIEIKDNKNIEMKENSKASTKHENIVKSPMVGVAYLSADPSSSPYIKIGQHVKQGDTLLLIEAMKTFNEVKAPVTGIVKEILVLNNQPVEFGDDLIIFE
jgi:acetyl-CoA carboxylase biotin carboxyl carrier protein